jgi:hypothetical protein
MWLDALVVSFWGVDANGAVGYGHEGDGVNSNAETYLAIVDDSPTRRYE